MPENTILSSPNRLQWFHWVLLAGEVTGLAVIGFFWTTDLFFPDPRRPFLDINGFLISIPIAVVLARSLYGMLRKTEVVRYSESAILQLANARFATTTPIPYSSLRQIERKSKYCLEFSFNEPILVESTLLGSRSEQVSDLTIEGNEDDVDRFAQMLAKINLPLVTNPYGELDPRIETATLAIVIMSLLAFMIGIGIYIHSAGLVR